MYFKNFPEVEYRFAGSTSARHCVNFTNLTAYSEILNSIQDDASLYRFYDVQDGDRPDTVSYRLYGDTSYYWTFYFMNPHLRTQGWPLSEADLLTKMSEDLPGECLVFLPQDEVYTGPDTGYAQHPLIDNFPIGSTIFGQISGAAGVVYARNVNLGQLFVRKTNNTPFVANEQCVNTLTGSPSSRLTARIVHNPAYLAVHHFEDGDGDHVDVDYALDFRGRGSELESENTSGLPSGAGPGPDGNYIGGVVGNLVYPDPETTYSTVTFKEFYLDQNEKLSRLKVLRKSEVDKISRLFHKSIGEA